MVVNRLKPEQPRRLVISGASGGLGLALARHYLEYGAIVAAFTRRGELLQALAAEFSDQVFCYTLDVRDASAVQEAVNDFIARVGYPDVVIANAGVIAVHSPNMPQRHWLYWLAPLRLLLGHLEPFLPAFWQEDMTARLSGALKQNGKALDGEPTVEYCFAGFYRVIRLM